MIFLLLGIFSFPPFPSPPFFFLIASFCSFRIHRCSRSSQGMIFLPTSIFRIAKTLSLSSLCLFTFSDNLWFFFFFFRLFYSFRYFMTEITNRKFFMTHSNSIFVFSLVYSIFFFFFLSLLFLPSSFLLTV